jgi:MFS family permease
MLDLAGYHLGVLNTALYWLTKDLNLDFTSQGATVVSAVLVGAVLGSLFAGQAADALGPKKALLINNAWLVAGCLLCAAAPGGYWGILAGETCLPLLISPHASCCLTNDPLALFPGMQR